MKNKYGVNLKERLIWINEGAEQYRSYLIDKIGYGFEAEKLINMYGPNSITEEIDQFLLTDEAKKLAKRLKKKAEIK